MLKYFDCICGHRFYSRIAITLTCRCGLVVEVAGDPTFVVVEPINQVQVAKPSLTESGRACWLALHTYPANHINNWSPIAAKQWLEETWEPTIPSSYGCDCVSKYKAYKQTYQSDATFETPEAFYQYTVDLHNMVNKAKGKEIFNAPSLASFARTLGLP
jgi:hypothetical protein